MRKHWYMITVFYCPVCASEDVYRERVYGKKPKSYDKTHKFIEHFDYCNVF